MKSHVLKKSGISILLLWFGFIVGCAGMEYAPKRNVGYFHRELPQADRAIEEARGTGKDRLCPTEFKAAAQTRDQAYDLYFQCKTEEAVEMARKATDMAHRLCPPSAQPKVMRKITVHAHFDFDQSIIRDFDPRDKADLDKAIAFIREHPTVKVIVEGHTDSIGTESYNQALSERRAEVVKRHLIMHAGIDASNITTVGYGETRPIASNRTPEGRFENRRVDVLLVRE